MSSVYRLRTKTMSLNNHVKDEKMTELNDDTPPTEKPGKVSKPIFVSFTRIKNLNGCYSTNYKGREIMLTNREVFKTDDKELIGFLSNDPELTKIK